MDYLPTLGEKWPHSKGNVGKYSLHGASGSGVITLLTTGDRAHFVAGFFGAEDRMDSPSMRFHWADSPLSSNKALHAWRGFHAFDMSFLMKMLISG